ncbi:MAG TPA: FCD domain-containing protein [Thermoanaerobacterales bacterium]|nr:FCD domain-containing protein [Thermoanaerobacterales bacterium]
MIQMKNDNEFFMLKIIESAGYPVGSGIISEKLKGYGFNISEATVGRTLRELDSKGYTTKIGFRGRTLTAKGRNMLNNLKQEYELKQYGNELISLLKAENKKELIDILIARKAIESELTRLATINAEERDIKILQNIIKSHDRHVDDIVVGGVYDVKFHKYIAKMAQNKVLEAAMGLIRKQDQLSPILGYMRKKVKSTVVSDHKEILKAMIKKDPEVAEKAMVTHIENLIRDVNKYWEKADFI